VEDRRTPGLYLEMTDDAPARYATERVPTVLEERGVARATWWENVARDRDDLPRVLPSSGLLGVYEVDDEFVARASPEGITGYHYRRTPGRGRVA